jgi:hypothetical protein
MYPNPYYPPPPTPAAQQKVAVPVWVIALVCGAVMAVLGMITLAFVVHHSPLIHRATVVHSQSYNEGYRRAQSGDGTALPNGWTAASVCQIGEGMVQPAPASAGDWIDGCTDGMHDRGYR